MKELENLINYMVGFGEAMQRGVDKFATSLPIYTKQHISSVASKRLNSTKEHYLSKTTVKMEDYVLMVSLDSEDWLVNALETGADPFNMKQGHLNSPKARVSKSGYKYIRIPIGKEKDGDGGPSAKGQDLQARINEVLKKPRFGPKTAPKISIEGGVYETQKIINGDPMLQGFYRTRKFDSIEEFHSGKKPKWQFVLFRTMSENPQSMSKWDHPGIQPVHILKDTEMWLAKEVPNLLDYFLEEEIRNFNQEFSSK
jgi:hypothetical protein